MGDIRSDDQFIDNSFTVNSLVMKFQLENYKHNILLLEFPIKTLMLNHLYRLFIINYIKLDVS